MKILTTKDLQKIKGGGPGGPPGGCWCTCKCFEATVTGFQLGMMVTTKSTTKPPDNPTTL